MSNNNNCERRGGASAQQEVSQHERCHRRTSQLSVLTEARALVCQGVDSLSILEEIWRYSASRRHGECENTGACLFDLIDKSLLPLCNPEIRQELLHSTIPSSAAKGTSAYSSFPDTLESIWRTLYRILTRSVAVKSSEIDQVLHSCKSLMEEATGDGKTIYQIARVAFIALVRTRLELWGEIISSKIVAMSGSGNQEEVSAVVNETHHQLGAKAWAKFKFRTMIVERKLDLFEEASASITNNMLLSNLGQQSGGCLSLRDQVTHSFESVKKFVLDLRDEGYHHQDNVNERFDKLEKNMSDFELETNRRFDKVNERFDKLEKRMSDFELETNQRFDKLEQNMSEFKLETNQRFDKLEQNMSEFKLETNQRFDKLEKDMSTNFSRLFDHFNIPPPSTPTPTHA